jgi:hypothetical protein
MNVTVALTLKRLGMLVLSLVVGFFGGFLLSNGYSVVSADHLVLNMWLAAWLVFGVLAAFFATRTKRGQYVYWTCFGLWVFAFVVHEFLLWPTGQCILGPCY